MKCIGGAADPKTLRKIYHFLREKELKAHKTLTMSETAPLTGGGDADSHLKRLKSYQW
jgi:hypothetical protein